MKPLNFTLPTWLEDFKKNQTNGFLSDETQISLAIELARLNVQHSTGGPFGAAIFDDNGQLISTGVNIVESACCSILHAEMVAIALAQQQLKTFSLGSTGTLYTIATSAEPCAMCYGAIPWSGISKVIFAANSSDVESIGFDEGDKPKEWISCYKKRGIHVVPELQREAGKRPLLDYLKSKGTIY
ncbi:MAG: nucleoside deaminase [Pseudomonadota bacterium]